tara:strand:+ start:1192 stop:1602 length:411 start_codon:yes stop_codon:yes gene_type:complete
VNSLGKNYRWVKKLGNKYGDYASDSEFKNWLAICLLDDKYDVMTMSFKSFIITYISSSGLFNVINLTTQSAVDKERTILIDKHIIKNFGLSNLKELRQNTLCSICDMYTLIDDIGSDILGSFIVDGNSNKRKLSSS